MEQITTFAADSIGGGYSFADAFRDGYAVGTAIVSAVDAVGGWGSYFEQVGDALGAAG